MKNETVKNINMIFTVVLDSIGALGSLSTVKKIHHQAMPKIKEAEGGKKAWFITVTVFTELMYIGFAIGTAMGAVCAIKERILDHNLEKELEEDEDSSEDSDKIKRYMEKWSSIRDDDDQVVMPR